MIDRSRSRLVALLVGVAVVGSGGAHDDDGKRRRGDAPAPRTESLDRPRHLAVVRYKPHVVLGWSYDGAMTTGFEVERSIVDGSPNARPDQFKRIGVAGRDARSFRDPTSRPGMTYIYRIRAAGPGTVSPYSTEVIVKINTASPARPLRSPVGGTSRRRTRMPKRRIRNNPDLDKEQAEGDRETVDEALDQSEQTGATPRADIPGPERQGITNQPLGEEEEQQRQLPVRGEAKKKTPGGHA